MRRVSMVASLLVLLAGAGAAAAAPITPAQAGAEQVKPAAAKAGSSAKAGTVPIVNINTATTTQLEELPGIGARTAQAIVDHRQKNGGFKKIEELMNVKGIGEKSFLKLKPMISVGAEKSERAGDRL